MTRIVVNPDSLKQSADKLRTVADFLRQKREELKHTTENAPSYDGQFGPLVFGISISAQVRSRKDVSRFEQHSGNLTKRAEAFQLADTAGLVGLPPNNPIQSLFHFFSNFKKNVVFGNYLPILLFLSIGPAYTTIINILRLGALYSQPKGMPTGFVFKKELELGQSGKVVDQLKDFENSDVGRELAAAAFAAGLLFVVMDGDKVVARWGKEGGEPIPISFGRILDENEEEIAASGGYNLETKDITLNEKYFDEDLLYSNTLPHEMQHAIDHGTILNQELINKNINSDMSISEIERFYADYYREVVITEINAHDVGFTNANSFLKHFVDRRDGIYTKSEIDFIVYRCDYESYFEDSINNDLKATFGKDTPYCADVWVDPLGNIKVDINQSRNSFLKSVDDKVNDKVNELMWDA